ncbi:MAG: class I SAM-dependent methyltransferase, partial [bacterium]|nr:class I SAM-dependent methyltransferase [bacterium]
MDSVIDKFKEGIELLKLPAKEDTIRHLLRYYELILQWNKKINLISRVEKDVAKNHILDSLSIYYLLKGNYLLDFGSGAGFPGIPL